MKEIAAQLNALAEEEPTPLTPDWGSLAGETIHLTGRA
jgi:hypothetical protein